MMKGLILSNEFHPNIKVICNHDSLNFDFSRHGVLIQIGDHYPTKSIDRRASIQDVKLECHAIYCQVITTTNFRISDMTIILCVLRSKKKDVSRVNRFFSQDFANFFSDYWKFFSSIRTD